MTETLNKAKQIIQDAINAGDPIQSRATIADVLPLLEKAIGDASWHADVALQQTVMGDKMRLRITELQNALQNIASASSEESICEIATKALTSSSALGVPPRAEKGHSRCLER